MEKKTEAQEGPTTCLPNVTQQVEAGLGGEPARPELLIQIPDFRSGTWNLVAILHLPLRDEAGDWMSLGSS
jgi:hypothetical protein